MIILVKFCRRAPALGAALWLTAAATVAQEPVVVDDPLIYAGPLRKQDEIYLLNTRQLGSPTGEAPPALALSRYNEQEQWEPISVEAFAAKENASATTLIYVHGYDFDEEKAQRVGWAFYHALCDELPAEARVRFVIWSWPTEAKKFRPVRDFIAKANRSDADAYYLAWLLAQLPRDTQIGLTGSALGCQVVQGALHLLGGGSLNDTRLARPEGEKPRYISTVFISPAVHNDWLYPGGYHQQAAAGTTRLLLVNNPEDAVLCRYGQAWKSKPIALGQSGLTDAEKLGELAKRIEQFDASELIGDHHGVEHYLRSRAVVERMRKALLAP